MESTKELTPAPKKKYNYKIKPYPDHSNLKLTGRPSHYKPEYCDEVVPLLAEGASIEEVGAHLKCGYTTVYQWMEMYPEFREAIKTGRELSKGWWIGQGRTQLHSHSFNSTLWYMNMKNRWGWSDKTENIHHHTLDQTAERVATIINPHESDS